MSSKQVEFFLKLRDGAQMIVDAANECLESLAPPGIHEKKQDNLPGSENLKDLPWKSYQTKEAAGLDEAAWVFADTRGAEALLAILKTKDKAQVGSFEYSRSGPEKQFISRKPLKPKT